jgi:hypothetical protein
MSSTESLGRKAASIRSAHRRRRERGAVLLEAVLVVSVLLLSLIGTVYVSRIYMTTLRAVGVSRAAAIGYSNAACRGDDTKAWFTEQEAALLTTTQGNESSPGSSTPTVADEAARRALSQAVNTGSFASPRVMSTTTGGEVFGPLSDFRKVGGFFYTKVEANDHVLCGEIEHMRGSLGVLGFARDFFKF